MRADLERLREELEQDARVFAAELASEQPDWDVVGRYISYAFVGRRGLSSYSEVVSLVDNPGVWTEDFQNDPIETMRDAVLIRLWLDLEARGELTTIQYHRISAADVNAIGEKEAIRLIFMISGSPTEIVWSREYGHWRISDLAMESLLAGASGGTGGGTGPDRQQPAAPRDGWAWGVRAGLGSSSSTGDLYDYSDFEDTWDETSWYAGLVFERRISELFWFETGIGITQLGHGYYLNNGSDSVDVTEIVTYLQIPLLIKIGFLGLPGTRSSVWELHRILLSGLEGSTTTIPAAAAVIYRIATTRIIWSPSISHSTLPRPTRSP